MHYCFYDGAIVVNHTAQQTHVVGAGVVQDAPKYVRDTLRQLSIYSSQIPELPINVQGKPTLWRSNMTKYAYVDKVRKIKRYIASGDIYQVNLAHRFTTETHLSPESVYAQLSQVNPAPYAAFIESDAGTLLSSSPECFLRIQDNAILTRPIKGTRARSPNVHVDAAQKIELFNCEKERAELLMIVDLERNDLGRICQPGSVQVKDLYHIESYATVHHMVGDVRGSLRPNTSLEQILRATFPGGSITGAPKLRAMEIIDELEPHQRNVYTGAIGLIGYDRAIHLNIAIRTLLMQDQHVYFQVGAGIVWDSDPIKEYEETLHKAKAIFEVFGADTHQTEEA